MKSWQLTRRMRALAEKLKPVPSGIIRVDLDSLSEPEKHLFNRILEIQREYGFNPPVDVIEANKELIFKASEVITWRIIQLFICVMRELLAQDEVEEWYFKLHFYNFLADLSECLVNVRKWSDRDREEFLLDMKESGMLNKVFRIPRGSSLEDLEERRKRRER